MYLDSTIGIYNRTNKQQMFGEYVLPACDYRRVCYIMIPRLNILLWNAKLDFFLYRNLIQHKKHPPSQLKAKHPWRTGKHLATRGNQEPFAMKVIYISKIVCVGLVIISLRHDKPLRGEKNCWPYVLYYRVVGMCLSIGWSGSNWQSSHLTCQNSVALNVGESWWPDDLFLSIAHKLRRVQWVVVQVWESVTLRCIPVSQLHQETLLRVHLTCAIAPFLCGCFSVVSLW